MAGSADHPDRGRQTRHALTFNPDHLVGAGHCGPRTRSGSPCQSPAVSGKRRCRMHGGAEGSGARVGNRNALKHGRYSYESVEFRHRMRELLRENAEKPGG